MLTPAAITCCGVCLCLDLEIDVQIAAPYVNFWEATAIFFMVAPLIGKTIAIC